MSSTGREMRRIANTDLVEGWSRHLDPNRPVLLVSFGRSGDSPESVATVQMLVDLYTAGQIPNLIIGNQGATGIQSCVTRS